MNIRDIILDFFYPKFCLSCGKEKTYLCPECFSKIRTFDAPFCPYCRSRAPEGRICQNCKEDLTGFVSAASYSDEILRKLIDAFKYSFVRELASSLAFLIFKFLKENSNIEFFKNPLNFLIIPIPLHPRRLRWRGFNQAAEIGKDLSPLLKIPMEDYVLFRKKYTQPQAKLKSARDKRENIKGVFLVENAEKIKNKKVILLDDVATSLSTMKEAAEVLKEGGSKEVWGLAVAKG